MNTISVELTWYLHISFCRYGWMQRRRSSSRTVLVLVLSSHSVATTPTGITAWCEYSCSKTYRVRVDLDNWPWFLTWIPDMTRIPDPDDPDPWPGSVTKIPDPESLSEILTLVPDPTFESHTTGLILNQNNPDLVSYWAKKTCQNGSRRFGPKIQGNSDREIM